MSRTKITHSELTSKKVSVAGSTYFLWFFDRFQRLEYNDWTARRDRHTRTNSILIVRWAVEKLHPNDDADDGGDDDDGNGDHESHDDDVIPSCALFAPNRLILDAKSPIASIHSQWKRERVRASKICRCLSVPVRPLGFSKSHSQNRNTRSWAHTKIVTFQIVFYSTRYSISFHSAVIRFRLTVRRHLFCVCSHFLRLCSSLATADWRYDYSTTQSITELRFMNSHHIVLDFSTKTSAPGKQPKNETASI